MITVPEAARRTRRDPETVRRWIRSGRLKATRIGTQHLIDEEDLARIASGAALPLPTSWQKTATGERMPDILAAIRSSRVAR
jgi:excisionase family DNA binding protein